MAAPTTTFTRRERWLMRLINLWLPYLGAGIRTRVVPGRRALDVSMKLHWWNKNYFGTHFGGSLYAMCDPYYVLLLVGALGRGYIVWIKSAEVHFLRPGRGKVSVRFEIPPERVEEIRRAADRDGKVEPEFRAEVRDGEGELVAAVDEVLYVRRKEARRGAE